MLFSAALRAQGEIRGKDVLAVYIIYMCVYMCVYIYAYLHIFTGRCKCSYIDG